MIIYFVIISYQKTKAHCNGACGRLLKLHYRAVEVDHCNKLLPYELFRLLTRARRATGTGAYKKVIV